MASVQDLWPPTFGAALFDFDGTLSDTDAIWDEVDERFAREHHIPHSEDLSDALAPLSFEGCARYVVEHFGLDMSVEQVCREWNEAASVLYRTQTTLRPGAYDYLEALHATGVPLAVATTNDRDVLDAALPHLGIAGIFSAIVSGTEVPVPKTKPDIYLEAARRLGVAPTRCIVFEDVLAGILSARSAGMLTCGIAASCVPDEELAKRYEADVFISSWKDIDLS